MPCLYQSVVHECTIPGIKVITSNSDLFQSGCLHIHLYHFTSKPPNDVLLSNRLHGFAFRKRWPGRRRQHLFLLDRLAYSRRPGRHWRRLCRCRRRIQCRHSSSSRCGSELRCGYGGQVRGQNPLDYWLLSSLTGLL